MALTRALAATGEQITNTENYVSSALAFPVQAYLPAVNAGASGTVAVGDTIEVESTAGGSIELLTIDGRRVGVVPPRRAAKVVARTGEAQSETDDWTFELLPSMNGSEMRVADVTIPTADVLTLNATPFELIPAPGAGKAIIFEGAVLTKAAGTAYANIAAGEDLALKYTDGSGLDVAVAEMTGFADQATAQVRYIRPQTGALAAGTVSDFTPVANAALVAHMLVGEIDTGDSDFKLRIFYRVVPTAL